jgi:ribosome-binding protein aMBF1 (putative translation factor)
MTDYQRDSVGRIVLEARKEKGLKTQSELAQKVKVDAVYICNIEKNHQLPSLELGAKIAKVLGLDLREFIFLILRTKYPYLTEIFRVQKAACA